MPKSDDPRIPLSKEVRKQLTLYKVNNDFKSYEEAIVDLLNKVNVKKRGKNG